MMEIITTALVGTGTTSNRHIYITVCNCLTTVNNFENLLCSAQENLKMMYLKVNESSKKLTRENTTHHLNQGVYLVIRDGMAKLVDLERGQFYGLDAIGTMMLSLIFEYGQNETIVRVTQEYDVSEVTVLTDLTELLRELEKKKLLISSKNKNWHFHLSKFHLFSKVQQYLISKFFRVGKIKTNILNEPLKQFPDLPSHLQVSLLLVASWFSFRILGWTNTIKLWQRWHCLIDYPNTFAKQEVFQAVDLIVREVASQHFLLPMNCKERALVGYQILRAVYGLPATLIIGIDEYPFRSHAWVEGNGLVITDDGAHCETFTAVARYS